MWLESLLSWSRKGLEVALSMVAVCPALLSVAAGDQLILGTVAQLESEADVKGVIKHYPHLKAQITEELVSRQSDPYQAYLVRSNAAASKAERDALAEAEFDRVQLLPAEERLLGLQRLSRSAVGEFALPEAAALRIRLRGPADGPPGYKALEQLLIGAIAREIPIRQRGAPLQKTDTTPARFRSGDFWLKCNIGRHARKAGLLSSGQAGQILLHRTATIETMSYVSKKTGSRKQVQYPDFSGYGAVLDPDGREIFRMDIAPGTVKPDPGFFLSASDDLQHKLVSSLSDTFCLRFAKAFGGF